LPAGVLNISFTGANETRRLRFSNQFHGIDGLFFTGSPQSGTPFYIKTFAGQSGKILALESGNNPL